MSKGHAFENPLAELSLLTQLSKPGHAHLVRVVEVLHNDDSLISVLEYAPGGELYARVTSAPGGVFPVELCKRLFAQMMSGAKGVAVRAVLSCGASYILVDGVCANVVCVCTQLLNTCTPTVSLIVICHWRTCC